MKKLNFCKLAGAVLAAALMSSTASAQTIRLTAASSHPPVLPWVGVLKDYVVPESNRRLEARGSKSRIEWTEAYSGALFGPSEALKGVEDGIADVAWIGTMFEPGKLPLHNVHFYAPFVVSNAADAAAIGNDLHEKMPALNAELAKYNQVHLGSMGDATFHLITKTPIKSLADLKGKKLLAGGAVARWLEGTGAIAVNSSFPEFYNNIATGVADGAVMTLTGMVPFKIHEVAKYVTLVDLGAPITGALTINADTWKKLPPDVKVVFTELGKEYSAKVTAQVGANEDRFLKVMRDAGVSITTLDASERLKWATALPNLSAEWVKLNESKGLPARNVMNAFLKDAGARGAKPVRDWSK